MKIKEWEEEECGVRCNNCMTYYEDDDSLIMLLDGEEHFRGCRECGTDGYLMNRD